MRRFFIPALASLALTAPALAFDWPWKEEREVRYGYCKGFTVAGLAALPIEDLSRTDLWLSWNHINRATLPEGSITQENYAAGADAFRQMAAAGNRQQLLEIAGEECDLASN